MFLKMPSNLVENSKKMIYTFKWKDVPFYLLFHGYSVNLFISERMEKTMFRKALALLLVLSLLFSIAGCGVNQVEKESDTTVPTNTGDAIISTTPEFPSSETTQPQDVDIRPEGPSDQTEPTLSEEDRLKAEEEARQEEERIKAEEAARQEEERLRTEQLNSFSMMYFLAITAEEIRTSKDNRLILNDIYTSLLNDINPGAIDELTQDHLKNLRDIIKSYLSISTKRDRLQFIYNQEKAAAIRSAVPNPLAILSVSNSFDWKKLAVSVVYTAVDSYNNYKGASENADMNFLMSGWELDDEEVATVQKNRDRAFDYMVDMVQEYGLDGMLTLNEKAIEKFSEICAIESAPERIKRLEAEEETYQLLGNYWLELAGCYFETSQYSKCLNCVDKYNELSTGIYRQDFNYVRILPKAIVAAQETYTGEKYISVVGGYADDIIKNTSTEDWATRYFAAQVYLDLYSRTNDQTYLSSAYKIASENVTVLLQGQRDLNTAYLNPVVEVTAEEPDYRYMTDSEKKEAEKEYKAEKKRVKAYNKELKDARKTELPSLYEPLVLNFELLFALADEIKISASDKSEIEAILQTESSGIFIVKPINQAYSFTSSNPQYTVEISKDEIVIPADLLTSESTITVSIRDGNTTTDLNDFTISKVDRQGTTIDTFKVHMSSKEFKKYKWTANSEITIEITYGDAYGKAITLNYAVVEYESHWYGDKVVFGAK